MVFVIGEIGVNWDGDIGLAKDMMINAKESGCDAVKFQAYNETIIKDHPEKTRLMKAAISKTNVENINEIARLVGIEWFCTPMYPDAVDFLEPFVKRFKIREMDGRPLLKNETAQLMERVLKTNKEIIVSCESSPKGTKYYNLPNIRWLYCVPKYPCAVEDLDFRKIKEYHGYSNHCPNLIAPLAAVILGAKILEIHITSDKSKNFVDNNISFDYVELRDLLKLVRSSEKLII